VQESTVVNGVKLRTYNILMIK